MSEKLPNIPRIGLIGCGNIAEKGYLPFLTKHTDRVKITSCFDLRRTIAEELAAKFQIPRIHDSIEDLLEDEEVDIVLNLTHPAAHAPVNLQALKAGKHTYCEKPFALTREEGKEVLALAKSTGLSVGCAPDTVLGPGTQTVRRIIEEGKIGDPLFCTIRMNGPGPEHWHINPAFYYQPGGGPFLDMGPYYLSKLIQCLGPIKSVQGRAVRGFDERVIGSEPLKGEIIPVTTPTHYTGTMETQSGVIVQTLFTFDYKFGNDGDNMFQLHGSEGALRGTNPNTFGGEPVLNRDYPKAENLVQPLTHHYEAGRGLGILDLIESIKEEKTSRVDGQIAYHILDTILAFEDSEKSGGTVELESTCEQPDAMSALGF